MQKKLFSQRLIEYNVHINSERRMDMSFRFNLNGQLQAFSLPPYKALWPLFETVVNAIQSIEDSENKECGKVFIKAERDSVQQINIDGTATNAPFVSFVVKDNGAGFGKDNYDSFCEAYSTLKLKKGCKGIGRFLWLKAFENVHIVSSYKEKGTWFIREFDFNMKREIDPEDNVKENLGEHIWNTEVRLENCIEKYQRKFPVTMDILAKKIIEHCFLYFLSASKCPQIILMDSNGTELNLNSMFEETFKDNLHCDELNIKNETFRLYHIQMREGAIKHELHLCANSREVKSINLSKDIPNLQGKIGEEQTFYYQGYVISKYLDDRVTLNRTSFEFEGSDEDQTLFDDVYIKEDEIIEACKEYVEGYLHDDLVEINTRKREQIDEYVTKVKPQYRYLLKCRPEVYDSISSNVKDEALDIELHKASQKWELDIAEQSKVIEGKIKRGEFTENDFNKIFNEYCGAITGISKASLAEYVIRRKSMLDLLEKALESKEDGKYFSEATIHSIICPMQYTSDDLFFEEMNLWIIDDRLSYHTYLASDKKMKSLPTINVSSDDRMDIAIFDQAMSFSAENDVLNSISIIEFKKAGRNDMQKDDTNPINQVLRYVKEIRDGNVKKGNGRPFGNVSNTAFFCYVIADLTETMKLAAENASLISTADGEGYFGYNASRNAYIEVISYDKLIKDAKQRNNILFDKLFRPNVRKTLNGRLL
jgi:hypothetical protein|nr:MAG TPA: ATPase [Caudoviricetes sp.]